MPKCSSRLNIPHTSKSFLGIYTNFVDVNYAQKTQTTCRLDQSQPMNVEPVTNIQLDSETVLNCVDSDIHSIENIRKKHHSQIANDNFDFELFKNNPLITQFGKNMYIELEKN